MELTQLQSGTSRRNSGGNDGDKNYTCSSPGRLSGSGLLQKRQTLQDEDFLNINKMYRERLIRRKEAFLKHFESVSDVATKLCESGVLTQAEKYNVVSKATRMHQKQALFGMMLMTKFKDIDHIINAFACDGKANPGAVLMLQAIKVTILEENPMDPGLAGMRKIPRRVSSMPPSDIPPLYPNEPAYKSKPGGSCVHAGRLRYEERIRYGELEDLEKELESMQCLDCLVNLDDVSGQTSLHACILRGNDVTKCMGAILKKFREIETLFQENTHSKIQNFSEFVDWKDKDGVTAVHLAAEASLVAVVKELYRTYSSDIFIEYSNIIPLSEDDAGISTLEIMYMKAPEAVTHILDFSITYRNIPSDGNFAVEMDFKPVIGISTKEGTTSKYAETALLANLINESGDNSKIILPHIIVKLFLVFKWAKLQRWIYASIFFHILMHLWYTVLLIQVFVIQCPYIDPSDGNNSDKNSSSSVHGNSSTDEDEGRPNSILHYLFGKWGSIVRKTYSRECHLNAFWSFQGAAITFLGILLILKEVFELWLKFRVAGESSKREMCCTSHFCAHHIRCTHIMGRKIKILNALAAYLHNIENVFQLAVGCVMIFVCSSVVFKNVITDFHYAFASASLMMTWTLILFQLGNISRLGIYVQILVKVVKRFMTLAMVYVVIIIAFAASFSIMFPNEKPFETLPKAIAKVMVMMSGELEYEGSFYADKESIWGTPVPLTGHFIYGCVAIVLTIILMNLLVGMVVTDVGTLTEQSEVVLLSLKIDQLSMMENSLMRLQYMLQYLFCGACAEERCQKHTQGFLDINVIPPSGEASCMVVLKKIGEIPPELRKPLKDFIAEGNGASG